MTFSSRSKGIRFYLKGVSLTSFRLFVLTSLLYLLYHVPISFHSTITYSFLFQPRDASIPSFPVYPPSEHMDPHSLTSPSPLRCFLSFCVIAPPIHIATSSSLFFHTITQTSMRAIKRHFAKNTVNTIIGRVRKRFLRFGSSSH